MRTHHRAIAAILGLAGVAVPTAAHAGEDNVVHVYSVTNANVLAETDVQDVSDDHPAGWSYVQPYVAGGSHYVFALKRHTGEARIFDATGGEMESTWASTYELGYDWSSAGIYYTVGGNAFLVLHRSRDGLVWRFALASDGTLGTKTVFANVSAWRDKSDFAPYFRQNQLHFAASDRWTGKAAFYLGTGVSVGSATWTQGWTSADYFDAGLAGTWRVLYKPLETPGDERGRLVVQSVGADGAANPSLYDENVSGWTHVRFVRTTGLGGATRIFFYNNTTGDWLLRSFSTVTGLGAVVALGTEAGGTNIAPNLVDLYVYAPGSTAYIYGVQEDGNPVLSPTELDSLAGGPDGPDVGATGYGTPTSIFNALPSATSGENPAGWEVAYMQSGRLVIRADAGMSNYSEDIEMDGTRHRLNWGSVAKAVTGVGVVKLAERGEIDLDAPLEVYLDPDAYPDISTDNQYTTTRELIEYRSGWDGEAGCGDNCETNWQCTGELEIPRGCDSCLPNPDGSMTCDVAYSNANFLVARSVIEWAMGKQQPVDIDADNEFVPGELVDYLQWLWWDRAGVGAMMCTPDPATHADTRAQSDQLYYVVGDCADYDGADECIALAGFDAEWREAIYPHSSPGNAAACGQGGIQSTAEVMARMLASLRYERVLSPDGTAYVLQANPNGGERAGFYGTTQDTTVPPYNEYFVGKNGGTPNIGSALIQRFGNGMDCAIVDNMRGGGYDVSEILKDSWLERTIP